MSWFDFQGIIRLYPNVLFFLYFGASACLRPFLSIILADRTLSEFQIGIVLSIIPLVFFFASPIGSFLFDRTHESKLLWIFYLLCTVLSVQLLLATTNVYLICIIATIWSFSQSPLSSINNHCVLTFLGTDKKNYGKSRLWGAVSWGISSFAMGIGLTYLPLYSAFIGYAIGFSIFILFIIATKFTKEIQISEDDEGSLDSEELLSTDKNELCDIENSLSDDIDDDKELPIENMIIEPKMKGILEELFHILMKRDVIVFYIVVFMMGIGVTVIYNFLFLYLEELGASETLMGISVVFTVATEIPFFFFSGKFLDWFGEEWLILSALIAYIIRVIGYSFLQEPILVLPLELLHGLTFGAMYAAGINYSSNLFPPHLSATGQGIFSGIYNGLGPFCGSLLGGWLYEQYGARTMYRVLALFITAAACILIVNFIKPLYTKITLLCGRTTRYISEYSDERQVSPEEIELQEIK